MAEVSWIKLSIRMFDDEKIKLIESMPEADSILVIWIRLLLLAGRTNDNGSIYLCEDIPYTDEMLATLFSRPLTTVRLALEVFERFKMIEVSTNAITLVNWGKYQNVAGLEDIRKKNAERQQRYRDRKKLSSSLKKEEDKEEDIDIETNVTRNVTRSKRVPDLKLGEFRNVQLTTAERDRLVSEFGEEIFNYSVEYLSMWKEEKGKRVKNDNLALRRWAINAGIESMNRRGSRVKEVLDEKKRVDLQEWKIQEPPELTPEEKAENERILREGLIKKGARRD